MPVRKWLSFSTFCLNALKAATEELTTILSDYNILSPFEIKQSYQNMLSGMLTNYILYKKKWKILKNFSHSLRLNCLQKVFSLKK